MMAKTQWTRVFGALLCCVLMLMSATALATGAADLTDEASGITLRDLDGNDYYEIATASELLAFASLANTKTKAGGGHQWRTDQRH